MSDDRVPILPDASRASTWVTASAAVLLPLLVVAVVVWQGPVVALLGVALVVVAAVVTRRASVAIAVPLLAAPVALRDIPGAQGAQVIHLLLVAVIAVVALAVLRRQVPLPPLTVAVGGVLVAALLLATLTSIDPFRSLKVSVNHVLGLLVCVAAAMVARRSHAWLREVLRLWTLASLVVLLPNLPAAAAGSARFGGAVVTDRAQGVFAQPNDFGEFSLYCIGVAWALTVAADRRADRVIGAVGLIVGLAGLGLSFSRGSWIGAMALVAFACLLAPTLLRRVVPVAGGGLVLAGVGAALSVPPFGLLASRFGTLTGGVPNPQDDRPVIYAEAFRTWLAHPLLGQGPGTFADVASGASPLLVRRPYIHAHSVPLDLAAETGVLGVLALAVVTGVAIHVTRRSLGALRTARDLAAESGDEATAARARQVRTTLALLGALLGGVAVHGMIDVNYTNPYLIPMAWTMLGLVLGTAARAVDRVGPDGRGGTGLRPAPATVDRPAVPA
ncbi:O-antigen ligase family protein [Phycicoccus flavus]|uniref:O-antigen ligase family protein n=1 Tax=Phycicoccus flavus TaxID=2502783 RepID=UPI000FEB5F98|nr:O-antigen ligase family protein [Phycicoccus flavus]NHA66589.1 O-antigen ligase family protein [Phycicoccus flavus]